MKIALAPPSYNFDAVAELFRVMAAPMRLRIINALCEGELNVGELLERVEATQSNMSQHLQVLYRARIVGRRRDGVQMYYFIADAKVVQLCRALCAQLGAQA